ncbi:hypothetical protein CVT25_003870, partial [Psilocybe cyanescens]
WHLRQRSQHSTRTLHATTSIALILSQQSVSRDLMSFIRRIFSKKTEEDYETILSNLANEVQERQLKLSEIRLRERRSTLVVTLYTLAAWGAYVSLWYLNALPGITDGTYVRNAGMERIVKVLPVAIGPIVILFIRRVVQIWYKRKGDAEEKYLKELMKKRRDKVEEIKKKTNYYSTRDLIQKYDDATPSATPLRARLPQGQAPPTTPMRPQGPPNGNSVPQTPMPSAGLQAHLSRKVAIHIYRYISSLISLREASTPTYPIAPPRKQWYDKLADALLGDDDPSTASPSSRYALICEKCFNHNGLVKESMWEEAQYVCPKCGHFNASARSKKDPYHSPSSPSTTTTLQPSSAQSQSGLRVTSNVPKTTTIHKSRAFNMESMVNDPEFASQMVRHLNKVLKVAHLRIQELESQIQNEVQNADNTFKERAAAAEYAMEVMRRNYDDLSTENKLLRGSLEELKDTKKPRIKMEKSEPQPKTIKIMVDRSISTEECGVETEKQELERALEMYYAKYKAKRKQIKDLTQTCNELQRQLTASRAEKGEAAKAEKEHRKVYASALAGSTIIKNMQCTRPNRALAMTPTVRYFYQADILKIELLGLQNVGFDDGLYKTLTKKFGGNRPSLPVILPEPSRNRPRAPTKGVPLNKRKRVD